MPPEPVSAEVVAAEKPPENIGRVIYNLFAPHGDFVGKPFRLRFKPFLMSQSVTGVVPLILFAMHGPESLRLAALIFLVFKVSIGALLSAGIISRFFPVMVSDDAIRARNFWGMARVVPFEDMAKVDPIRWLIFTRFARISTHRYKNWVWLPLFLEGQSEFEARVLEAAPVDNPLRLYFENSARNEK